MDHPTVDGPIIGRTTSESTPWWPEPVLPAAGTPNVVVVLLDDTGFAILGVTEDRSTLQTMTV